MKKKTEQRLEALASALHQVGQHRKEGMIEDVYISSMCRSGKCDRCRGCDHFCHR